MREEIERITHRVYTGSLNHRATSSPQSNHWVFTMQPVTDYTYTTHKDVTLNPTKPTHLFSTQQTPQARITLTLQDFTAVIQRVIWTITRTWTGLENTWNHSTPEPYWSVLWITTKLKGNLAKTWWKTFSQIVCSFTNHSWSKYQPSLFFYQSIFLRSKENSFYKPWTATVDDSFEHSNQLKQIFKKLLWPHTFNRLKPRFNRLNGFVSYITYSKKQFQNPFSS